MKDLVKETKEEIVMGIANDGKPPEAIRSLEEISRYAPKETSIDQFARAVDGLIREGVTPTRPKGYAFEPNKARGVYL